MPDRIELDRQTSAADPTPSPFDVAQLRSRPADEVLSILEPPAGEPESVREMYYWKTDLPPVREPESVR